MESFVARLTAKRDAVRADHDALQRKVWDHREIVPPAFEDVVAAMERDPIAAAATYAPIRDRIVAHKAEHAADRLRLRGLDAELTKLRDDVRENEQALRKVAKETAMGEFTPKYAEWTAVKLMDRATALYSELKVEMFGRGYKFGGYIRDEEKVERMNTELDALTTLLSARHSVRTIYANNTISFAEDEASAGAKRRRQGEQ